MKITTRKSARKNFTLTYTGGGLFILKAPLRATQHQIQKFLKKSESWAEKQLTKLHQEKRVHECDGGHTYLFGKKYALEVILGKEVAYTINHDNGTITIQGTRRMKPENIISKGLRLMTEAILTEIFLKHQKHFFQRTGLQSTDLKFQSMTSRWGSCSSKKIIKLNTRLIYTPRECIDYVILHELCHLKHMNHGPLFHNLQSQFVEDAKSCRIELKKWSSLLR